MLKLTFHRAHGNPPIINCNACGNLRQVRFVAAVPLPDTRDTANIVVCSRECETAFRANPNAEDFIAALVEKVTKMREERMRVI